MAHRRPSEANLTISAQPCVVANGRFRCPSVKLSGALCSLGGLEILIIRIDATLREKFGDPVLYSGAPVTLPLPRDVELARVVVRCSSSVRSGGTGVR